MVFLGVFIASVVFLGVFIESVAFFPPRFSLLKLLDEWANRRVTTQNPYAAFPPCGLPGQRGGEELDGIRKSLMKVTESARACRLHNFCSYYSSNLVSWYCNSSFHILAVKSGCASTFKSVSHTF